MRQFLSALPTANQEYKVSLGHSADAVSRGGLASPVFPAFGGVSTVIDDDVTGLLFCFADSAAAMLRHIQNEESRELQARTMMSHGLASVIVTGEKDDLRAFAADQRDRLAAFELWPLKNGVLVEREIERYIRDAEPVSMDEISADDLKYDAACQVRQLNVNLAFAVHRASVYTPELVEPLLAIKAAASGLVDKLRLADDGDQSIDDIRKHHWYVSRVLEVNAGLAMVISQTLGGVPPLLNSEYPVGEYSLLGIGSAARALWAFYQHLHNCFREANHGSRLAENAAKLAAFDPFLDWSTIDYTLWNDSPAKLPDLPLAVGSKPPSHLLHFSSRFGFHETAYALGASWQSLHASSSREWHLLTVTHEFMHSQVRQITSAIYPGDTNLDRLSELFAGKRPANALESMQVALIRAMQHYETARHVAQFVDGNTKRQKARAIITQPSPDQLRETLADELRYFQEIVVHVLDLLYTFHGEPKTYLAAIWQSWSTVPSVTERIHDYLLRSLCALSAVSPVVPKRDASEVFEAVVSVAEKELAALTSSFKSPVVAEAANYLATPRGRRRLQVEFRQAYYIARFTKVFFFDSEVATALQADDLTAVGGPGAKRYPYSPGYYPDSAIASPLGFLSDRFQHEEMDAGPELEFASLWQLLLLADSGRDGGMSDGRTE